MPKPDRVYSDPHYQVVHQSQAFTADTASATDFAIFRCREKCLVTQVHYRCLSAPSLAGSTLLVRKAFVTLTSSTIRAFTSTALSSASAGSVGGTLPTMETITLTTNNTLASVGEGIAVRSNDSVGEWEIIYEYQILPPG